MFRTLQSAGRLCTCNQVWIADDLACFHGCYFQRLPVKRGSRADGYALWGRITNFTLRRRHRRNGNGAVVLRAPSGKEKRPRKGRLVWSTKYAILDALGNLDKFKGFEYRTAPRYMLRLLQLEGIVQPAPGFCPVKEYFPHAVELHGTKSMVNSGLRVGGDLIVGSWSLAREMAVY